MKPHNAVNDITEAIQQLAFALILQKIKIVEIKLGNPEEVQHLTNLLWEAKRNQSYQSIQGPDLNKVSCKYMGISFTATATP